MEGHRCQGNEFELFPGTENGDPTKVFKSGGGGREWGGMT